jgi:lycopene beta-cyclase
VNAPASPRDPQWEVAIVGDGPAGLALGQACSTVGLRTVVIGPNRPWTATYATWLDDVAGATADVIGTSGRVDAVGWRRHLLEPSYGVFDNALLRAKLGAGVQRYVAAVLGVAHGSSGSTVTCADGEVISTCVVVDASGSTPALLAPAHREAPLQTAFGVVVDGRPSALTGEHAVLMDWSPPPGFERGVPTFLYAIPLPHGRWLAEETSLARRNGLAMDELRARLTARLGHEVIARAEHLEEVVIPMVGGVPDRRQPVVGFGAAGRFIHPATGYSVATSLRLTGGVAAAIARSIDRPCAERSAAIWDAVWPRPMRQVRAIHDYGLHTLLRLSAHEVGEFFDAFFELPTDLWRTYLEIECTPREARRVMTGVFRAVPWRVRRRLAAGNPFELARVVR